MTAATSFTLVPQANRLGTRRTMRVIEQQRPRWCLLQRTMAEYHLAEWERKFAMSEARAFKRAWDGPTRSIVLQNRITRRVQDARAHNARARALWRTIQDEQATYIAEVRAEEAAKS